MNKKRIIKITILFILAIITLNTNVGAMSYIGQAIESADNFVSAGQSDKINFTAAYNVANYIYILVMTIAIIVAIVRGAWIANKIILGTIVDRSEAKKMIIDYIFLLIGLAVIPTIIRALINLIP